ncbi:MAG: TonB-dependent receptor plug domain-containing protein [Luteimonas sp.]
MAAVRLSLPHSIENPRVAAATHRPSGHPLAQALLAVLLLGGAAAAQPAQAQPAAGGERLSRFEIPAGPLDAALNRFGRQSGVDISVDAALTSGRASPGVTGQHAPAAALDALLRGTRLAPRWLSATAVLLEPLPDAGQDGGPVVTGTLSVSGGHEGSLLPRHLAMTGHSTLTREDIDDLPAINRNLTDVLARLPGVTVSGRSRNSMGNGEITPDDISIHGARFYDNQFLLDGASINSDLDPAYNNPGDLSRLASHGQGYFVDLDAIESVTVHDHNVSARHGGFTGGVVDAQTRRYSGQNRYRLSWRHTSDSLSRFHVDPAAREDFDSAQIPQGSAYTPNQPEFRKDFFTFGAEVGHGGDWGSAISASWKDADIPLFDIYPAIYEVGDDGLLTIRPNDGNPAAQYRQNFGFNGKTSWQPGDGRLLDIALRYSKHRSRLSMGASSNSAFDNYHEGHGIGLRYEQRQSFGTWTVEANFDALSDEREVEAEQPYLHVIMTNQRNFNSGVPGPMERSQKTFSLRPSLQWDPLQWLGAEHAVSAGLEASRVDMQETRKVLARDYSWACGLGWPQVCAGAGDFYNMVRYGRTPYSLDLDSDQYALWIEDGMRWERLDIRAGLRVDHSGFLGNTEVAPRLAAGYDLSADGRTRLKAGFNRYYGRSFLELEANRIRDLSTFQEIWLPGGSEPYFTGWGTTDWEALDNARTPYNDEAMLGVVQAFGDWTAGLDWVHRRGRDQFSQVQTLSPTRNRFGNEGRSETNTVTLRVDNRIPLAFLAADWRVSLLANWQKSRSNASRLNPGSGGLSSGNGYNEIIGGGTWGVTDTSRVILDGKVIALEDMPATAFNARWRSSLEAGARWAGTGISWNNFIDLRAPYRGVSSLGAQAVPDTSDVLRAYETAEYGTRVNWDMQLRWEPSWDRLGGYVQVDVLNVLDRTSVSRAEGGTLYYDIGRQFWVEFGVRF